MPPTGQIGAVQLGPGILHVAPLGTTAPTSASGALDNAFREVGFTEEGSSFNYELTSEPIEVAELFDPVEYATTGRRASVTFQMAETSRQNLALALNAGANAANGATAFEPPDPGTEVAVMMTWTSDDGDGQRRWLFRQVRQSGGIEIIRRKSPAKSMISATFSLEKPSGSAPFKVWPNANGLV